MKLVKTIFSIMAFTSLMMFAAEIDLRKLFTDEDGYDKAMAALATLDATAERKAWLTEYISLAPNFKGVDFNTVQYAEVKSRAIDISAGVFDAFISNMFIKNDKVIGGYLADSNYNDINVSYRKFTVIPGRISKKVAKGINTNVFAAVIAKGATSKYADNPNCERYFQQGVMNLLDKVDELQRDKALTILKDLKRVIYKNIQKGDDWKAVLTDLEIKIQSLQ